MQDAPVFQDLPERIRDDATQIRNKREPVKQKDIGEGHTLDRRSGMGRVYQFDDLGIAFGRKEEAKVTSVTRKTSCIQENT